jgi:phosphonate transport system substrate-binding protein
LKTLSHHTNIKIYLAVFIFVILTGKCISAEKKELLLGSVAMDIPAAMHKRLYPLTEYLQETLNIPISLKLAPNMGVAINDVAQDKVDIAYLTPVAYLKAHKKGNSQIIAKTVTKGKASFQLMIVVKETSPIKNINDLVGKSFAFGDKRALLQRAAVVGSGITLDQLGSYEFIGHYDNIASAVMHGDFDAGILKDTMAFKWENKGLRILYASPHLPPYNITISKSISPDLKQKITNAFLSLDGKNPKHLKVIKALDKKYNGFAATSDEEYDVVRNLTASFEK